MTTTLAQTILKEDNKRSEPLLLRSYYNSKGVSCNDSSYLKSSKKHEQECYEIPSKSHFVHLNAELLHPEARNHIDYSKMNILLVSSGSPGRTAVLESLKTLHFNKFVCLHKEKRAWAEKYFDDWIIAEDEDVSKRHDALTAVKQYCAEKNIKFDAILSYDDYVISTTAFIQEGMKIPGAMSHEACEMIKNKHEFRKMCKSSGISCLKFFLIQNERIQTYVDFYKNKAKHTTSLSEIGQKTSEPECINFPLIMKHSRGSGKDFVKKCDNMEDFLATLVDLLDRKSRFNVIVEEFYDGHELDIEVLIQGNKVKFVAISDNFPAQPPYFFELGGIYPSIYLSKVEKRAIRRLISLWVPKMNFMNGLLHFEAKCRPASLFPFKLEAFIAADDNSKHLDEKAYFDFLIENQNYFLMPIEINPRLGAEEVWSMTYATYDINLIHENLRICLGIDLNQQELDQKRRAPMNQCVSKVVHPGIDAKINSIKVDTQQLFKDPNLVEACLYHSPGDTITYLQSVGFVAVICNPYDASVTSLNEKALVEKREKIAKYFKIDLSSI